VDEAAVRRELRRGGWWLPRRGVIAVLPRDRDVAAHLAATAAVRARRHHVISHRSAALLHGLELISAPRRPELSAPHGAYSHTSRDGHVRTAWLEPEDVDRWWGAPVVSVARTIVDLARTDAASGLVALDGALRDGVVDLVDVIAALDRAGPLPGTVTARAVLPHGSPLAESALESLTRWCLVSGGVPAPELQVVLVDPSAWIHRVNGGDRFRLVC